MDVVDAKARDGMTVEVDVGLHPVTRTAARSRFVEAKAVVEPPRLPEVGAPWCPLTVRARLHRMSDVFRRLPHTPDTKPGGYRSCMPEPIREIFKDQPGEPMRIPVGSADLKDAMQVLDSLIQMSDAQRTMAWGIAVKAKAVLVAKYLKVSDKTAKDRMLAFLDWLAIDWNGRGWMPSERDVAEARELIRRKD